MALTGLPAWQCGVSLIQDRLDHIMSMIAQQLHITPGHALLGVHCVVAHYTLHMLLLRCSSCLLYSAASYKRTRRHSLVLRPWSSKVSNSRTCPNQQLSMLPPSSALLDISALSGEHDSTACSGPVTLCAMQLASPSLSCMMLRPAYAATSRWLNIT